MLVFLLVGLAASCLDETPKPDTTRSIEEPVYMGKPAVYWLPKLQSTDAIEQLQAATAMGVIEPLPSEAATILIKQLKEQKRRIVRRWLVVGLGNVRPPSKEILSTLIETLMQDQESDVREAAAQALGKVGQSSEAAARALAIALQKDRTQSVRWAAVDSLCKHSAGIQFLVPVLPDVLQGDAKIAFYSLHLLAKLGPAARAAVPTLSSVLNHEIGASVRAQLAVTLGQIGQDDTAAVPPLIALLKDSEAQVRQKAAEALGELGKVAGTALPALRAAQNDSLVNVSHAAAIAIHRIQKQLDEDKPRE